MTSPAAALGSGRRLHLSTFAWALLAILVAAVGGYLVARQSPAALDFVLAVTAALGLARFRFLALAILILLMPLDKPSMQWVVITGGLTFLIVAMRRLPAKWLTIPWIAFVLLALTSVVWTPGFSDIPTPRLFPIIKTVYLPATSVAANEWLGLVFALVMFLLAAWLVRDRRHVELTFALVLIAAVWPIVDGIKEFAQGGYDPKAQTNAVIVNPRSNYHSIQGLFDHPNPFGFYLIAILLAALVAFMETKRTLYRVLLGVVLGAGGFCLLQTYGRGAWIGFALGVLILGIWRYRMLLLIGLIILPIAAFAFPSAVRDVANRFGDLASSSAAHESNSLDWRRDQWSRMLPLGREEPLTGQGFGSYQRLTIQVFGFEDKRFRTVQSGFPIGFTAHNDYVKTFVEMGWPGLLLWLAVFAGLIWTMVTAARIRWLRPWAICVGVLGIVSAELSAGDNIQAGYSLIYLATLATLAGAVAGAAMWARSEDDPARLDAAGHQGA